MSKLLITGYAGLVGSNICKVLERDYPDIEITKVKYNELALAHQEILRSNISDEDYGNGTPFDYIIHAAGYGQPQMFCKDKLACIRINTETTDKLFSLLKIDGKFLFISSSEIYSGALSPHKETDIGTTTPQHSRACYIEGKRCGEAICMAYKEQGYDVKIARLALAYGPGTKKGDTRVINQFIEQSLTTGNINVRDAGKAMRTYLYVEDCAEMILDILFKGTQPVYNVGGNSRTSIADLASKIGKMTNSTVQLRHVYKDDEIIGAPDDVKLSLALTLTEFPRTFVSLDEGLKRTIEYQKTLYGK